MGLGTEKNLTIHKSSEGNFCCNNYGIGFGHAKLGGLRKVNTTKVKLTLQMHS